MMNLKNLGEIFQDAQTVRDVGPLSCNFRTETKSIQRY